MQELPWHPEGFPKRGILYFFCDAVYKAWGYNPEDKEGFRVLFFDGPEEQLSHTTAPSELNDERVFKPVALDLSLEVTLPKELEDLDYGPVYDNYSELLEFMIGSVYDLHNRLLGHPQSIQADMKFDCAAAYKWLFCEESSDDEDPTDEEIDQAAKDRQLLLQLDSEFEKLGWMWGDAGRLYFWIRKKDLRNRVFQNVWMILQCS
ncbi:Hypothetical protein PBC10988_4980 [Planctomycetales bacterium 10988]|nr:Hypothetical protein PBC10988_4980 [Planctomycetales bacterium 10988]